VAELDERYVTMTMTTLHLGQVPGRARHAVACARPAHARCWRSARTAPAFGGFRATRLAAGGGYTGDATPVDESMCTTINPVTKRSARHLRSRST
jgi:hypothetical protein